MNLKIVGYLVKDGMDTLHVKIGSSVRIKDGNESDSHRIVSECHLLPYFNSDSNTDTYIIEYEYKMNVSDSDFHSDIYSIQHICNIYQLN